MGLFYYVALTTFSTWLLSQMLKIFVNAYASKRKISFRRIMSDGEYPSSHTAFITCVTTLSWIYAISIYQKNKEATNEIWIAIVLTAVSSVIIRDALGVRYTVQKLCESVSALTKHLRSENIDAETRYQLQQIEKNLNLKSGHRPHEVVGGALLGIIIAMLTSTIYYNAFCHFGECILLLIMYLILSFIFVKRIRNKTSTK